MNVIIFHLLPLLFYGIAQFLCGILCTLSTVIFDDISNHSLSLYFLFVVRLLATSEFSSIQDFLKKER